MVVVIFSVVVSISVVVGGSDVVVTEVDVGGVVGLVVGGVEVTKGLSVTGGEDVRISGIVVIKVDVVGAEVGAAVVLVVPAVVGGVVVV